jgi:twitching motility protein PilT
VDFLKKVLKIAIQENADSVRFQVGQGVSLINNGQEKPVPADIPVDAAYMNKLYGFLFPNDKPAIAAQQLTKGVLNIPGVGKLNLIALPAAPQGLRLYTPKGQALFESEWTKLNSKTISVAPGTGGPGSELGGGIDVAGMFAMSPPPPVKAAPAAPPPPAAGGFIPNFAEPPPVGGAAPTPVPPKIPLAAAAEPSMPPAFAPAGGFAPAMPHEDPFAAAGGGQQYEKIEINYNGGGGYDEPEAPKKPMKIDFGGDEQAIGEVSDGRNPIDDILKEMVRKRASDLHVTGGQPICMRVDGEIERTSDKVITAEMMESYLTPIMPQRNLEEFLEINDTDFAYELKGVSRFRVNVFRDKNGVGCVMRSIPSKILTAEQLNLPPVITKFCYLTKGLVVVTGPTGSGKSTTLAAMVDLINKTRSDHILTIEDPVEFVHPQQKCLVNQREVGKHTKSFSRALKAALREDPDIVLIGEMRDLETIAIAIETAETGHLVFGTLHTTTAVSTVDRIIDQFPSDRQEQIRMMLSSSLKGVIAQTLLKRKGGGRVAAHEILITNDAVSAMIREGKNHMINNHMQSQKQDGNQMLNEALTKLVRENLVEPEEAYMKAVDKNGLLESLKRAGVNYTGPKAVEKSTKSA